MSQKSQRLLILGLDGATWSVLNPMRQRGVMPNLDALIRASAHGTLRSVIPPVTTAAWTSLMTGCGPARHGVFDHRYYDARTRQMKVNHSGRHRVPTFWHLLSDAGHTVGSLNVPGTYPPLSVRGVVVSGMDAPHLEAALSGNADFAARMRAEAPGYSLRYFWKHVPATLEELQENARLTAESFRGRAEGGWVVDRAFSDWSVLMVQFQNLDPFQHRAWKFLNVDATGIENAPWNDAAASVLRGLDQAIGRLCELAEKRGAAILVASDHGFGPCEGRISVNRILIDAGVARLHGAVGRIAHKARCGLDQLRLRALKRNDPSARTSSFTASVDAQFPLDWSKTRAFAPHQDTAAMIYLNTRSNDPRAPLVTPRQIDDARNETVINLATARHPETGEPLFPRIIDVAQEYGLDPAALGYPDLIALPHESHWVRTKLSNSRAWVEHDPALPGTHRPEGIVALKAQGVAPTQRLEANLVDIAPTVLALFGQAAPAHMEGTPLPCVDRAPQKRTDAPAPSLSGMHTDARNAAAAFEYSAEDQAIIEQRLADLGYLE